MSGVAGFCRETKDTIRGASKIKLKKVNKKRTVTVRRVIIFFKYLKASIADLITLLSSSVQNSIKAVATATGARVFPVYKSVKHMPQSLLTGQFQRKADI
jgi:hypothetical protein